MNLLRKLMSSFLILTFLVYDLTPREALAQEAKLIPAVGVRTESAEWPLRTEPFQESLDRVEIPHDIGEVIEKNEIQGQPLLYVIEDIHCHSEAQKNIQKILQYLMKGQEAKGEKLHVLAEAASGPMDMQFFWGFPDKEVLKAASLKFLENHDINGVEAFLIEEGPQKVEGIGVEEIKPYVENVKSMGELLEIKESEESEWIKMEEVIHQLRERIYPSELRELMEFKEKYESHNIKMGEYLNQISNIKNQNDKSEIKIGKQSYPQITRYLELKDLEEKIDLSAVEGEYLVYLEVLEKSLVKEEAQKLLREVLEYRLGKRSEVEHYLFLKQYLKLVTEEKLSPLKIIPPLLSIPPLKVRGAWGVTSLKRFGELGEGGVMKENDNPSGSPYFKGRENQDDVRHYKNLELLFEEMELMKNLSWEKLEGEIQKLADSVERTAYSGKENEEEIKKLLKIEKSYAVLNRVISMEGTREDIGKVFYSHLKVRGVRGVMREEQVTPSFPLKKARGRKDIQENQFVDNFIHHLKKLTQQNNLSFETPDLSEVFGAAEKFYKGVLERDEIFQEKIQKIIRDKNLKSVALVVGGFHTEGIKEKLKAANIGYWVIAPHTSKIEDRDIYFRKMKEFSSVLKGDGEEPGDALGDPTLSLEAQLTPEHLQARLTEFIQVFKALIEVSQKNKEGNTTAAFAVNQILVQWAEKAGPFAQLIQENLEGLQLDEESQQLLEGLRGNLTSETPATRALAVAALHQLVPDLEARNLLFQRMGIEGEQEDLTGLLKAAQQNAESLQAVLRALPNDGGGGGPSDSHQHSQEWPSPLQKLPNQQELPFYLSSLCESLLGYTNTPPTSTTAPNDSTATLVQSLNAINASLIAPAVSSSTAMFTSAPPSTSLRESLSQFIQLSRALIQMLKQAPGEINGITQAQTGSNPLGLMPWF
ncbi:MAG: hypothetical protein HYZ67_05185, partial [Chlamydiae bacterium]|nr:hypothetical protein [Chlamydiota bacterium]